MIRDCVLCAAALLAACGQPSGGESADAYAERIGASGSAAEGQTAPAVQGGAQALPPTAANPLKLDRLGDASAVDLGPSAGGCSFTSGGEAILIAAAPVDRMLSGKARVRITGKQVLLDAAPGGMAALRDGTTFAGEGFSVTVTPASGVGHSRAARLTMRDAGGAENSYSGDWVCQ